jgi:hypothetical protein
MNTKIILAISVLLVGAILAWVLLNSNQQDGLNPMDVNNEQIEPTDNNGTEAPDELTQEEKESLAAQHLTANISLLSPEPEVLGGMFYVTDIRFTSANSGVVEYEDGHIALVADFTYEFTAQGNAQVTLTNVRENVPEM